jgi:N-methylhydantoinase B
LVTEAGAKRYGVIVADMDGQGDWQVDAAKTEKLRGELKSAQKANVIFDFGPSIDQLRIDCLAETGLPAPLPPESKYAMAAE